MLLLDNATVIIMSKTHSHGDLGAAAIQNCTPIHKNLSNAISSLLYRRTYQGTSWCQTSLYYLVFLQALWTPKIKD